MSDILISIDQSYTYTALVIFDIKTEKTIFHKTISTQSSPSDHLQMFKRAKEIKNELISVMKEYEVNHLAIEGLAMGNVKGNSNRDLAILQGIIIDAVLDYGVPENNIYIPTPTHVKKVATGKGNIGKKEMVEFLPDDFKPEAEKYLKTKGRYDITDAYFIGKCYLEEKKSPKSL